MWKTVEIIKPKDSHFQTGGVDFFDIPCRQLEKARFPLTEGGSVRNNLLVQVFLAKTRWGPDLGWHPLTTSRGQLREAVEHFQKIYYSTVDNLPIRSLY
jgi:hypothetical protein